VRGATTQHRFFSINAKLCIDLNHRGLVIADDILLLAPSVHGLEKLLRICEKGLDLLDVIINTRNYVVYVLGLELICLLVYTTSYDRCGVSVGERI